MVGPYTFRGRDTLPEDWNERCRQLVPTGLDAPWGMAAKDLVTQFGESSLSVDEVAKLLSKAYGLNPDGHFRVPLWLESIPNSQWAISTAWSERNKAGQFTPGDLWAATETIRSIDTELDVASFFGALGFDLKSEPRAANAPDWSMSRGTKSIHVEVKSKGPREGPFDFISQTLVAMQLVDAKLNLRGFDWVVDPHSTLEAVVKVQKLQRLPLLGSLLFNAVKPLSDWVGIQIQGETEPLRLSTSEGTLNADWYGDLFGLAVSVGADSPAIQIYANPRGLDEWFFLLDRAAADWEPERVDLTQTGQLLESLLLRSGGNRGKQMQQLPPDTIYVIRWEAPVFWDDALAKQSDDIQRILDQLTAAAAAFQPRPAIALWPRSFTKTSRRVILNKHAQALLEVDSITDRRFETRE